MSTIAYRDVLMHFMTPPKILQEFAVLWWGSLNFCSSISPLFKFLSQNQILWFLKTRYERHASLQFGFGDACQIYTWYSIEIGVLMIMKNGGIIRNTSHLLGRLCCRNNGCGPISWPLSNIVTIKLSIGVVTDGLATIVFQDICSHHDNVCL